MSENLGTNDENVPASTETDEIKVTEEKMYTQSEFDRLNTQGMKTTETRIHKEYAEKEAQAEKDRESEAKAKRQARLEKEEKFKELYQQSEDSNTELKSRLDKVERDSAVDKLIAEREIPVERQGLYRATNCSIDELAAMMDVNESAHATKVQDQKEVDAQHNAPKGTSASPLEDLSTDPAKTRAILLEKAFQTGSQEDADAAIDAGFDEVFAEIAK